MYHVKWLNFPVSAATWEPQESIPKFIQLYYESGTNFGQTLPNPKIKNVKKAGSAVYHLLTWENDNSVGSWVHEDFFQLLSFFYF